MSAQLPSPTVGTTAVHHETRGRVVAGVTLIVIGLLALAAQLTNWSILGWIILPTLALIFLARGILTRNFGLIIPGCILSGLGLGLFTMIGPVANLFAHMQPAVFLLCFAAGWALIAVLSLIFSDRFQWWPLIPGAIIGLIALFLLGGGFTWALMQLMGYGWALILIGIGVYLLLRRKA